VKALSDEKIIQSWEKNAHAWVNAIDKNEIESRIIVTNQAIVNVILSKEPTTVLDIGCGEGWLSRELNNAGIDTLGIDIVDEFISYAQHKGRGRFKTLAYEEVSAQTIKEKFDVIVCNFSLLGNESVQHLFKNIPTLLNKSSSFIVQTIHPLSGSNYREEDYNKNKDGWRKGSWQGFNNNFCDPAPWFYRTMESWKSLFLDNGFQLSEILEPHPPNKKAPASIIFIGELVFTEVV